jgi:hypothetical protein
VTHALTLRLTDRQAAALGLIARVEAVSVTETIRAAIDGLIAARLSDAEWRRQAILDTLSAHADGLGVNLAELLRLCECAIGESS